MTTALIQLITSLSITLPSPKTDWRVTKRISGEIQGIPTSRGVLVATNGMLCIIEQNGGQRVFEGHLQHFVADKLEDKPVVVEFMSNSIKPKVKSERKSKIDLDQYE